MNVNPAYRHFLTSLELTSFEDFWAHPAVIVTGHPDRHVVRVTLGRGEKAVAGFMKRQHRVSWKERLGSAWAGFGLVSKSTREAVLLDMLKRAGVGCPEFIAADENGSGQAFLLVRELLGFLDLRVFLDRLARAEPSVRRRFACRLGQELGRLHAAGFAHPDLYAKHVLVNPDTWEIAFLDWQRSRFSSQVKDPRDLAALDATLADNLASSRERLLALRAYCRVMNTARDKESTIPAFSFRKKGKSFSLILRAAASVIHERSLQLRRRRRIQEMRLPQLPPGTQDLVWMDGEALCVTAKFRDRLQGHWPAWLMPGAWQAPRAGVMEELVLIPGGGQAVLVRRKATRVLASLWSWFRGHGLRSPELNQAAALFRLQRQGVSATRLLAFGQRHTSPWSMESFLLTERAP